MGARLTRRSAPLQARALAFAPVDPAARNPLLRGWLSTRVHRFGGTVVVHPVEAELLLL